MKRFGLFVLLAASCIHAQTTLEKCGAGSCYGFGPPTGQAANGYIYQDVSQTIPALFCAKNGAWVSCGGSSAGSPPAGNPLDVQTNLNGTAFGADPGNFSYTAGTSHTLNTINQSVTGFFQIAGTGSRKIAVTNPVAGQGQAELSANVFNDKRVDERDFERETIFGGPGGMNYGNGPNVTRSLWTTSGANFWNFNFNRRGITQQHSGTLFKRGTGDYAWDYANQVFGVGGVTGTSDEGGVGSKLIGGEFGDWYTGTATAGAATGSTTLPVTSGVQTCDGCFVYDASKAGPTGHFTAAPVFVTVGSTGYWSEAIDTAVTPSTAFGVPVCNLPQLADQTVPQTVACTVTGALGSTGIFANGIASLSGPYAEQVSITVAAPVSGTQTVNITYRNPHASGAFMLWQGGTAQGMLQVLPALLSVSGEANGQTVFGAPDSTHIAAGVALGGTQNQPVNNFSGLVPIATITKSGSVATANFSGATPLYVPFSNLATAIISNTATCTGGSMNGTATGVTVNFLLGTISWTDATSSTGCATGNISLPISNFAYQLFPYAEQIASGDNLNQIVLEPNKVAWASGDSVVEPHPPTFDYNSRWDDVRIFNPNSITRSTGIFQTYAGAGINGLFNFIRLFNQNPCSMYQGCGGSLGLSPWMSLEGPNSGTISSTVPIDNSKFALKFACVAGFSCTDVEHILSFPLGSLDLDSTNGWHFFQGVTAPTGSFPNGVSTATLSNDGTGVTIKTNLSSSGGTALKLQGQFNNGGAMADIQFFDFQDSVETGRIRSSLYFGNLTSLAFLTGSSQFLFAKTNGAGVDVDIATPSGSFTNNSVAVCLANGSHCPAVSGISGQTAGFAVEAATATTATGPFPLDDSITTAATITAHKKFAVASGGSDPSQLILGQVGNAPTVVANAFSMAAAASVTTGNTVVGFTAPCSGVWTLTNTSGIMTSTCTTASVTIASGTSALGISAIASGTCATVVTTAATGAATTDVVPWSFNADPTSITGYSPTASGILTIIAFPTANNVNFKVCNNTSASITPGAVTLNWRIAR